MDDHWSACIAKFRIPSALITSITFSPDGTRLSSCSSRVDIWDISTGRHITTFVPPNHVTLLPSRLSPNWTHVATSTTDNEIIIWDIWTGKGNTLGRNGEDVHACAFSPDMRRFLSISWPGKRTARLWDLVTGQHELLDNCHPSVNFAIFSPDSNQLALISSYPEALVELRDFTTGKCTIFEDYVTAAFSPDGRRLALGSLRGKIELWDVVTGKWTATGKHSPINDVLTMTYPLSFSPNGNQLVSAIRSTIKIWDTATMKCLAPIKRHDFTIRLIAFSADGSRLASMGANNEVWVWDVASITNSTRFEGHGHSIESVSFSPDNSCVVTGDEYGVVKTWDLATGSCLETFEGYDDRAVTAVAFSSDGSLLAASSKWSCIRILSVATRECVQRVNLKSYDRNLAFSIDGRRLIIPYTSLEEELELDIRTGQRTSRPLFKDRSKTILQNQSFKISDQWLTYKDQKLLWLPCPYRSMNMASTARSIVVGCDSGRVWMLTADIDKLMTNGARQREKSMRSRSATILIKSSSWM